MYSILGDDEMLCNRVVCSQSCTCRGFSIDCSYSLVKFIPASSGNNTIRILHLSHTNLSATPLGAFHTYIDLFILHMRSCSISKIPRNTFNASRLLRFLDLSYNAITFLHQDSFRNLVNLQTLILTNNRLQTTGRIFSMKPDTELYELVHIDLSVQNITYLPAEAFNGCPFLKYINLSHNPLYDLSADVFSQSREYLFIDLEGVPLRKMHSDNIYSVYHIEIIVGEIIELCCISQSIGDCRVSKTSISDCEHLISPPFLKTFVWINGITVTALNSFVIWYRLSKRNTYKRWAMYTNVYTLIIGMADLLMGLYLLCLAIVNIRYSGRYASFSFTWRSSFLCRMLAMVSTMASELSLLLIVLLTFFQLVTIKFIYGTVKHVKLYVIASIITAISLAIITSLIPILNLSYFGNGFLSISGTCLLYQLVSGQSVAEDYSVIVWVVGNLVMLFLMTWFQIGLAWKVFKSRSQIAGTRVKAAASHTNAIFVLFVTAALVCWAPILTTMLLVRVGVHVSEVVSEYIVIMMLPLKALVNPLQYTVRTMKL